MVNHGEKWLKACDNVFLEKNDKVDRFKSLKLSFMFV